MVHRPAPIGGLNALSAASAMPPTDCILVWNMLAAEYGLRSRFGYREWARIEAPATAGAAITMEVRTILPFHASTAANSKLFAVTNEGIWNVTSQGAVTSAYLAATAYIQGEFATSGGLTFGCKTAGTTHATAGLPSVWVGSTGYAQNDRVINGDNVYICATAGTSAASGGPTGTGSGITDGTAVWNYQSADTAISDGTATWSYQPNNTAPTQLVTFSDQGGNAGYGEWVVFVSNADGGHTLVYCDEVNGLYYYRESTAAWEKPVQGSSAGQINGIDPTDFVFPIVYKGRLWFVERNSGSAWYLAADTIYGTATEFKFGNHFTHGGHLVGLYRHTKDGGDGIDDPLVAVSSAGDILIYQVTDPATPTGIYQFGQWYAGGVPAGRDICTKHGGDLLVLTKNGILPLSRLAIGQSIDEGQQYTSYKIANLFNQLMYSKSGIRGWSMVVHPEENTLLVTYPTQQGQSTEQLVMNQTGKSWTRYTGLPIFSAAAYDGKLYFGTTDGRICINDGYVDNVLLADPNTYSDIAFHVIPAFMGDGRTIQGMTVRTHWLADGGSVPFTIEGRYDFDTSQAAAPAVTAGSNTWDNGLWDTATWSGEYTAVSYLRGIAGAGRHMSVAIHGKARARTVLAGMDVTFTQGGVL